MKRIIIVIISFILIFAGGIYLYNKFGYVHIVAKFNDLEPLEKQLNVYFKGFKVGRTIKVYPDKNYQNTYIEMKLKPHNINLPDNIEAKLKKPKIGNGYIDLIYPSSPSLTNLKNMTEIKGIASKDINSLLNDKLDSEVVEEIVTDATNLVSNANTTIKNLGDVFTEVKEILQASRSDIKTATTNLAKTSKSLEQMAANLNDSLDKDTMKNSIDNIESAAENINRMTQDLNNITTQMDKSTFPIVNSILCQTHSTVKNVNEITGGIKNTLQKRMGLGRLMFGRPISKDCEINKY